MAAKRVELGQERLHIPQPPFEYGSLMIKQRRNDFKCTSGFSQETIPFALAPDAGAMQMRRCDSKMLQTKDYKTGEKPKVFVNGRKCM